MLLIAAERGRSQGLEELRHDQARRVIVRAALHALHVLHSQLLLAGEFSVNLVSPVAVIKPVPGCADIVGVVIAHRPLVGGEDQVVGRVVELWHSSIRDEASNVRLARARQGQPGRASFDDRIVARRDHADIALVVGIDKVNIRGGPGAMLTGTG